MGLARVLTTHNGAVAQAWMSAEYEDSKKRKHKFGRRTARAVLRWHEAKHAAKVQQAKVRVGGWVAQPDAARPAFSLIHRLPD